jgi:hypothetical protein
MSEKPQVIATLVFEKDTRNTQRFQEHVAPGKLPVLGTVYVPKGTLDKLGNPGSLVITIEAGD